MSLVQDIVFDKYLINENGIIGTGWIYTFNYEIQSANLVFIENLNQVQKVDSIVGNLNKVRASINGKQKCKTSFYFFAGFPSNFKGSVFLEIYFKNEICQRVPLITSPFESKLFFYKEQIRYSLKKVGSLNWIKHTVKTTALSIIGFNGYNDLLSSVKFISKKRNSPSNSKIFVIDHLMGGGANYFRDEWIAQQMQDGYDIYLLGYLISEHQYVLYHKNYLGETVFEKKFVSRNTLEKMVAALRFDKVYLNNIVTFPEPLFITEFLQKVLAKNEIHLIVAIHDFFAICPSFNLLNVDGEFCDIPEIASCQKCLPEITNPFVVFTKINDVIQWRKAWYNLFSINCEVHCFSISSKELFLKAFPGQDSKVKVIPHKVPRLKIYKPNSIPNGFITIGVIGNILHNKGSEVIKAIYELIMAQKLNIRFVVIGNIKGDFSDPFLIQTGNYKVSDLSDIVAQNNIDFAFMPSIWPETFSYVSHEIKAINLPLVTFNFGAQAEVAKSYEKGFIIEYSNPDQILNQLLAYCKSQNNFFRIL